jgi:lipopolysaccharide/colanic/teichoic acid biosynthesis glycosyltransferase
MFRIAKRVVDITGAMALLLLLLPLLLGIAAAIGLTSPGPILYTQPRFGRGGRVFQVLKFRTMHAVQCDQTASRQTARDDPRITALGRQLRALDLDELPQLLNVLKGDMSLIGPRPHPIRMKVGDRDYEEIVPDYRERLLVRPGITGLAQISGYRGPVDTIEHAKGRQRHDLEYVRNLSLRLEVSIIMRTIAHELSIRAHAPADAHADLPRETSTVFVGRPVAAMNNPAPGQAVISAGGKENAPRDLLLQTRSKVAPLGRLKAWL